MKQKRQGKIYSAFSVILAILMMPFAIPFGLAYHAIIQRRMRKDVQAFNCVVCYCKLNLASLDAADAYWGVYMDEMHQCYPGEKLRVVRNVDAVCTTCTTHYQYLEKERKFIRVENLRSPFEVQNMGSESIT
jgi:hypothetical protein